MPCCLETFCESGFQGVGLQRLVEQLHPNFECEKAKCSIFSPGPVDSDETIIFLLVNPTHYDAVAKVIVPQAFQEAHNRDLSILRAVHSTAQDIDETASELIERGMKRVPPQMRLVEQGCTAKAQDIRNATDERGKMFAIYDTGLEHRRSHASVFVRPDLLDERKKKARVRSELHRIFTTSVQTLDELKRELS